MAQAIDTLGFVKRLRDAGVDAKHAEAHAEAIRDVVMPDLATKADIQRLEHLIERQTQTLTIRLGGLILIGIGALATLEKLLQ